MIKYFYKALRWTAIPLVIAGFLTLLSGFTTTKYFVVPGIGYSLSYFIHTIIFPLVFLPLFFIHSLAGTLIVIGRHKRLNRKPLKALVVILWLSVLGIFIFLYAAQSPALGPAAGAGNTSLPGINGTITLSPAEIAKHSSAGDCWIIISNKVYDVTAHLLNHPAGAGTITPYCGLDATTAYETKGGRGAPHSSFADSTLGPILLGNVGDTITSQAIQQAQNQTLPITGNGRESEDD